MAFENSSKIADIMMGSMGKFPSAIGGLSQGYQQGLANRQNRELMGMKRDEIASAKAERERKASVMSQLVPQIESALGVPPGSLPPGLDMDDAKGLIALRNTADERTRSEAMRKLDTVAGALVNFNTNVPEASRPAAYPQFVQQMAQISPEYAKALPQQYDPVTLGNFMAQSDFYRDVLKKSQGKPLVNIEKGAFNADSNEFRNIYQEQSEKDEAKSDSDFYTDVTQGVRAASEADYRAARMEASINQGLQTNAAAPIKYAMQAWGNALGLNFENVGSAQELERLALDAAMQELQSFKGPTTDFEFGVALKKVGNLGTDPEAFRRYIQLVRRTGQRDREIFDVVEQYKRQNEGSLRGVQGHVSKWIANNPLVATVPQGVDPHEWIQTVKPGALFVNPADGKFLIKR